MNQSLPQATKLLIVKSANPRRMRRCFLLLAMAVGFLGLTLKARAADGGLPNFNTAEGDDALAHNTGFNNTAMGFQSLFSNTSGDDNTAIGSQSLVNNTTGFNNTAVGFLALSSNTTGILNTAVGLQALGRNTTGSANTAFGLLALGSNTTGANNTATGIDALLLNSTGSGNTASGFGVLEHNETGSDQVATGLNALFNNTTGNRNTAEGYEALFNSTTGNRNTAEGYEALFNNTTGSSNIALGYNAGRAVTTGSDNIEIGNSGRQNDAGQIRIGRQGLQTGTFIAGIFPTTIPNGVQVVVNENGRLGVVTSSARFKEAIKSMDNASEAILSLQPVTFRYKHELDPNGIMQFGLVAEEVAKVSPELVVRDAGGKVDTVRYDAINAMLLNEFLKQHRVVQELRTTLAQHETTLGKQREEFQTTIAQQQRQIEALTATVQKVSEQIVLSKVSPQVVVNP